MSSTAQFTAQEIKEYEGHFASMDTNGDGFIDRGELIHVLKNTGLYKNDAQVDKLISEVDKNANGVIEFAELLDIILHIKSGRANTNAGFAQVYTKQKDLIQVKGLFCVVHKTCMHTHTPHCPHLLRSPTRMYVH
jgi:Ca2+-binding EF-hand superfamily protein